MRNRGTAAQVSGEQTYAFSSPYEKTSLSKRLLGGLLGGLWTLSSTWKI